MPALEVSVTDPPWQKVVEPPAVMVGVGNGLTVTDVEDEVAEQVFPSVTFTVKDPELLTLMD